MVKKLYIIEFSTFFFTLDIITDVANCENTITTIYLIFYKYTLALRNKIEKSLMKHLKINLFTTRQNILIGQ